MRYQIRKIIITSTGEIQNRINVETNETNIFQPKQAYLKVKNIQ